MTESSQRPTVRLMIYKAERLEFTVSLSEPLVLGRQDPRAGEPTPFAFCDLPADIAPGTVSRKKLVIAGQKETYLSRNQVLLERLGDKEVRIANLSDNVPLTIDGNLLLPLKQSRGGLSCHTAAPPIVGTVGECSFRVEVDDEVDDPVDGEGSRVMTLDMRTLAPGQRPEDSVALVDLLEQEPQLSAERLAEWLLTAMSVFFKGSNAVEFLSHATESVGRVVGLDYVAGMLYSNGRWKTVHDYVNGDEATPSSRLLQRMVDERRSFRCIPKGSRSLDGIASVVAAPILGSDGEIVGALYGHRRLTAQRPKFEISQLEQMVVELVAAGTASGIARLEQQKAAMTAQVQFEQFFGPMLAQELNKNREMLKGRTADVTVLFCDIRGFSRISNSVGPERTLEWINDVLNEMSKCVVEQDGVLVDYVGDEIMAMWGAPRPLADHAERACAAALDMRRRLDVINDRWQPLVQEWTDVGIGINTGEAIVGNTGSEIKFKYGPMGTTVNMASRVCSATKRLRRGLLITGETFQRLSNKHATRRLCTVEVNNIAKPVDLYEVVDTCDAAWSHLRDGYEAALGHFENSEFRKAVEQLGNLLMTSPADDPTMILLSRAVTSMTSQPLATHPVWVLEGK